MPDSAPRSRTAARDEPRETPRWLVTVLTLTEDIVYLAVALVLVGVAIAALYNTIDTLLNSHSAFAPTVTAAVNGVLFVVIVLEIFRTVLAHLEGGGFQLRPFLIIGIISVVRHILLVGATSVSNETNQQFNHAQIELGVNAAVALALVIALVLLHRGAASSDDIGVDDD
ncbi:MAG TPA: phosphate-starvation-inducible PsiE family protein [Acidimicrobiia bacterium]|nr:phosphate-starvation-inducible PsiE family protein [Acidimicrobiia bacterium]